MATLTQTAIVARRGIRYSFYGLIILITGRIVLGGAIGVFRYFFPSPPPAPTVLFNKLPEIAFPENRVDPTKLTFTLETPQGGLPKLVKGKAEITQANVYFMPKALPDLFSVQLGLEKGKKLGFIAAGQQITETMYRFKHPTLPKTLEINVVSDIFSLSYDLAADPSPINSIPPAAELAASQARSYLQSASLLPDDLTGPVTHQFLRIEQGKLVPALSLSEAQLTRVDLFRSPYGDDYPSVGPNPGQANVWFMISGSTLQEKKILAGEYHYLPLDAQKASTYPIKTAQEAWNDLTLGNAFIAQSPSEGDIVVRRVYLAYYDPDIAADFYQPIVVFEGDNFSAYVPAVTPEYYGE